MKTKLNVALLECFVIVAVLVATIAMGSIGFTVYPNGTDTAVSREKYGEAYEDAGASTLKTYDYSPASGTATSVTTATKTDSGFPIVGAVRIAEESDARASSTARVGVMYFYWDTASETINIMYKNATGTAFLGRVTATSTF